jgi:hypothetical protein
VLFASKRSSLALVWAINVKYQGLIFAFVAADKVSKRKRVTVLPALARQEPSNASEWQRDTFGPICTVLTVIDSLALSVFHLRTLAPLRVSHFGIERRVSPPLEVAG